MMKHKYQQSSNADFVDFSAVYHALYSVLEWQNGTLSQKL